MFFAMGRSDAMTRASLRFGLGRTTTPSDIDTAISAVVATVTRLRREMTTKTEFARHESGTNSSKSPSGGRI